MKKYRGFDIQQDDANNYQVIRVDAAGIRRSLYTAKTIKEAIAWIKETTTEE